MVGVSLFIREQIVKKLVNFILFQIGWLACVMSAAAGEPLYGLLAVVFILIYHFSTTAARTNEIILLVTALLVGTVWDSLLVVTGLLDYDSGVYMTGMAPYWITAMWALFAITLNHCMHWLQGRWVLATLLGAIFGPLAYYAGNNLGAVDVINLNGYLALAIGWSVLLPLQLYFARFLARNIANRTHEGRAHV